MVVVAAGIVTLVIGVDVLTSRRWILAPLVLIGPLVAAASVGPGTTALIAGYAVAAAVGLGWADDIEGTSRHAVLVGVVALAGVTAVWLAERRARPEAALRAAEPDAAIGARLRLALEAGGMGTWRWDRETGRVETDRWLSRLFGDPPGGMPTDFSAWSGLLEPEERARANAAMSEALATGGRFRFDQRCVWPDGSVHWLEVIGEVTTGPDGRSTGAIGVTVDVGPRREAEAAERAGRERADQAAATMARFYAVTDEALSRLPLEELLEALPDRLARLLACDMVRILLLDEARNELRVEASYGFLGQYRRVPIPVGRGFEGRIAAADEPVVIEDMRQLDVVSPALRAEVRSAAGVPLRAGTLVGVLDIGSRTPRRFHPEELDLLRLAGERIALAIERSRRFELERTARERADYLARINRVLSRSIDLDVLMAEVTRAAVPRLGDWCSLVVLDPATGPHTELAHVDPEKVRWARELSERFPYDPDAPYGAPAVIRSGKAEFYPEIDEEMIAAATDDEEVRQILGNLQLRSSMIVPVRAGNEVLGALQLVRAAPGPAYTPADLRLAEDIADRIAAAVQNSLLYEHQRRIAETLQRSLLPMELPAVPGAELAVRYWPAVGGADVGGDFYDVVPLGPHAWGLAVGDISGKGITAAALTAVARHTIRAAARHGLAPAEVLAWVHDAMADEVASSGGEFCTAVYGVLRRSDDGRFGFRFSLGGHPSPLYVPAEGDPRLVGRHGSLLGVLARPRLRETELSLFPGDVVILYTDGVTDVPGATSMGDDELLELVRSTIGGSAEETAARLQADLHSRHRGAARPDDTALLVVRITPEGPVAARP